MAPQEKKQSPGATTGQEKAQVMIVLGAAQHNVQKMGPEEVAVCGLSRSKRPHAIVQNIVAVNKMVGCMKALMEQCGPSKCRASGRPVAGLESNPKSRA